MGICSSFNLAMSEEILRGLPDREVASLPNTTHETRAVPSARTNVRALLATRVFALVAGVVALIALLIAYRATATIVSSLTSIYVIAIDYWRQPPADRPNTPPADPAEVRSSGHEADQSLCGGHAAVFDPDIERPDMSAAIGEHH
jgi:hypothetical protein